MRPRFAFTLSLMLLFPSTIALIQSNPAFSLSGSPIAQSTASASLQTGLQQLYTSQLRPAIASFQSAISLAQKSGDRPVEAAALLGLSETKAQSGRHEESLAIAQQALTIYRDLKNRTGEAEALQRIGDAQTDLSQPEAGLKTLQQARAIWRELGDRQNEAWTLGLIGIAQFYQDQKTGLESMHQAIVILQESASTNLLRQQYRQGILLASIGYVQMQQNQIEPAKKSLQAALDLGKKSGNLTVQKYALLNTAALYQNQKQPKEAIATYQQALTLAQQLDDRSTQAGIYRNIGNLFKQIEQFSDAQQAYQKSLTLYQAELTDAQKNSMRASQGVAQYQIGLVYVLQGSLAKDQGQYQNAIGLSTKALLPLEQAALLNKELTKVTQQLRASSYGTIASGYNKQKQYELALVVNQKELAIAKESGDSKLEQGALLTALVIYTNLSNSLDNPVQYDKKLEVNRQIISMLQKVELEPKQRLEVQRTYLKDIASIYKFQGKLTEALGIYQQLLTSVRENPDIDAEQSMLMSLGRIYQDQANYTQALATYQQSLQLARQPQLKRQSYLEAIVLNNLAIVYSDQGNYSKALSTQQQSLEIYQRYYATYAKGLTLESVRALCLELYFQRSSQEEYCHHPDKLPSGDSLNSFKDMIAQRANGGQALISKSFSNTASIYLVQGELQKALNYYQQAFTIDQKLNDPSQSVTLNNIGYAYRTLGDYPKALDFTQQALKISVEQGDRAAEAVLRGNLGGLKSDTGHYAEAMIEYQQSLKIARQFKQRYEESNILSKIATDYSAQGKYTDAISYYQQALKIQQDINVPAQVLLTLANLGTVYSRLGQYEKAIHFNEQALTIARNIGARQLEAEVRSSIGAVNRLQGNFDSALDNYQKAQTIAQSIQARLTESNALQGLGKVYTQQSQPQQALTVLQQAYAIALQTGRRPDQAGILADLGEAQLKLGNPAAAQTHLQNAITIAHETGDIPTEAQALNTLGNAFLLANRPVQAEQSLRSAIALYETIRLDRLSEENKISLFESQRKTYSTLQQVLIAQNQPEAALSISEWGRTKALIERLSQQLHPNSNRSPSAAPTLIDLKQIAQTRNATIVEYSLIGTPGQEKELYTWVIQPSGTIAFRRIDLSAVLPKRCPRIAQLVEQSRDAMGVRGNQDENWIQPTGQANPCLQLDFKQNLATLHRILIEPIAALLPTDPNQTIVFVPQDSLFLVPFPALLDANGKYLIEQHTIQTTPSIQLLAQTRDLRATPKGSGALIVGNPTMPVEQRPGSAPKQLPALPGSEQEANAIAPLLGTKALTQQQATKAAVLKQLPTARIVHFGTHGLFDDRDGLKSAIALAPSESDPGFLTAEEILKLNLKAELVVLSACNSGRGKITGDGVVGLSRSFIAAGVPSVLVSLWSVPDQSTSDLMTEFYTQLNTNPNKAQAIRRAMLKTMETYQEPRNWAAFTLIGEAN